MSRTDRPTVPNPSGTDSPVSTDIAIRLASELDCEVTDLTPLAESVDPESLNRLFENADPTSRLRVSIRHEGCRIEITPQTIDISRIDDC